MPLQFVKKEAGDFADIFDTLGRAISLLEREMVKILAALAQAVIQSLVRNGLSACTRQR